MISHLTLRTVALASTLYYAQAYYISRTRVQQNIRSCMLGTSSSVQSVVQPRIHILVMWQQKQLHQEQGPKNQCHLHITIQEGYFSKCQLHNLNLIEVSKKLSFAVFRDSSRAIKIHRSKITLCFKQCVEITMSDGNTNSR